MLTLKDLRCKKGLGRVGEDAHTVSMSLHLCDTTPVHSRSSTRLTKERMTSAPLCDAKRGFYGDGSSDGGGLNCHYINFGN